MSSENLFISKLKALFKSSSQSCKDKASEKLPGTKGTLTRPIKCLLSSPPSAVGHTSHWCWVLGAWPRDCKKWNVGTAARLRRMAGEMVKILRRGSRHPRIQWAFCLRKVEIWNVNKKRRKLAFVEHLSARQLFWCSVIYQVLSHNQFLSLLSHCPLHSSLYFWILHYIYISSLAH